MSRRTAGANRAIREAGENEKRLVLEGKGTRDWTDEQQKQIAKKGKAYDGQGRAFEGQHMKSVSTYPEYQDDARNIQFLSREEHLAAHGGSWKNPTNGYYDPVSKTMSDFGDGPPQPCAEVPLTSPLYADLVKPARPQSSGAGSEGVNAPADMTAAPKGRSRLWPQSLRHVARQVWTDPRLRAVAAVAVSVGLKMAVDAVNQDRSPRGNRTGASPTQSSMRTAPEPDADSSREARQSPDEHDVSGYTRKNGTIVQPYRRGGKRV